MEVKLVSFILLLHWAVIAIAHPSTVKIVKLDSDDDLDEGTIKLVSPTVVHGPHHLYPIPSSVIFKKLSRGIIDKKLGQAIRKATIADAIRRWIASPAYHLMQLNLPQKLHGVVPSHEEFDTIQRFRLLRALKASHVHW